MKKAVWIILGVIAVLAVVLVIVLVIAGQTGNELTPENPGRTYEYTVAGQNTGVLVTVKNGTGDGYTWAALTDGTDATAVPHKADAGKTAFLLENKRESGLTKVTLVLRRENGADGTMPDYACAIAIRLSVDNEGKTGYVDSTYKELGGLRSFDEDGDHPYRLADDSDGTLLVSIGHVDPTGMTTWVTDGNGVRASVLDGKDDTALFRITVEGGRAEVLLTEESTKTALRLSVSGGQDGIVSVLEHGIVTFDPGEQQKEQQHKQVESLVGAIEVPEETESVSYRANVLRDSQGEKHDIAQVRFTIGNVEWNYYAAHDMPMEVFRNYFVTYTENGEKLIPDAEPADVGGAEGICVLCHTGYAVMWENEKGDVYAVMPMRAEVSGDYLPPDAEETVRMACRMYAMNPETKAPEYETTQAE